MFKFFRDRNGTRAVTTRSPPPEEDEFSCLECVVTMLKSSRIVIRKHFVKFQHANLWLTPDMKSIKWRVTDKGQMFTFSILLSRVRSLKSRDREISLLTLDDTRTHILIFISREDADMWLTGLSCLIPARATIKSRSDKDWGQRQIYDPLQDSWYGKRVSEKRRLQNFVVLGSIGSGAYGSVKLGLSLTSRQFYAIKFLSKSMMRRQSRNAAIVRVTNAGGSDVGNSDRSGETMPMEINEISIMQQLKHENVVQMKEVFDDDENDCYGIVIEYVSRGPVMSSQKLQDAEAMDEYDARKALVDVLAGLSYLQANCVVHRDIKPDNLLRAGDGTVKISDFGSATKYENSGDGTNYSGSYKPTVGTPAFTAPELCHSDSAPNALGLVYASDIWSLGASLYYMVFGRAPFLAQSVYEMYDVICTSKLDFPQYPVNGKTVSPLCKQVIAAMLATKPDERATIDEILRMPWISEAPELAEKSE